MRTPSAGRSETAAQSRTAARAATRARAVPTELANILGVGGALLAVVAVGAGVSAALPQAASPWLFAAAYGAPAAVAFTIHWWIDQRP